MTDNYYKVVESCQIPCLNGIFQGIFGQKSDGTFVEVGAFDGHEWSNTFGLAEIGWAGLCIEPVTEFYDRCVGWHKNHPKVVCSKAFIGDKAGIVPVYKSGDTFTANLGLALTLGSDGQVVDHYSMTTLDLLLPSANIYPLFQLLVIDVEGFELEVLRGFTLPKWMPRVVIIESHAYNENPVLSTNATSIYAHMIAHGYKRIYADRINDIYLRCV